MAYSHVNITRSLVNSTDSNVNTNDPTAYGYIGDNKLLCWYTNADSLKNKLPELANRCNSAAKPPTTSTVTETWPKTAWFNLTPGDLNINAYDITPETRQKHKEGLSNLLCIISLNLRSETLH